MWSALQGINFWNAPCYGCSKSLPCVPVMKNAAHLCRRCYSRSSLTCEKEFSFVSSLSLPPLFLQVFPACSLVAAMSSEALCVGCWTQLPILPTSLSFWQVTPCQFSCFPECPGISTPGQWAEHNLLWKSLLSFNPLRRYAAHASHTNTRNAHKAAQRIMERQEACGSQKRRKKQETKCRREHEPLKKETKHMQCTGGFHKY